MTDRAKIIEMAREAGIDYAFGMELERFAALVRAMVLEEAAQVCEQWGAWNNVAQECAGAIRGMADSGHSAAADAGASTAPLPEPVWCECGDGIMPNTGAQCGTCACIAALPTPTQEANRIDAQRYRWLRRCRGQEHDPLFTVQHELDGILWGGDLDAAIDAAMSALPADGGAVEAVSVRHGSNVQAESASASASPSVLLIRGEK